MKKSIVTFVLLVFTSFTLLISCKTQEEKVEDAQEEVYDAEDNLLEAKQDSVSDYDSFKADANKIITSNEVKIAELKIKISKESQNAKANYIEKVIHFERKNKTLKAKLNAFAESNGEDWEFFKAEIKENTDQLEKELNELNQNK